MIANRLPAMERPLVMGILNVTPDSFSDGGRHFDLDSAVAAAERMVEEGADIVDVGGESTRPGAEPVPLAEEIRRVVPVVERLARQGVAVSIDTRKAGVAERALDAGAAIVNDVSGLEDPAMTSLCARAGCIVCLMHMRGTPQTMRQLARYEDVVEEVREYLVRRTAEVEAAGIARDRVWIDPGIGFAKTGRHDLQILHRLERFVDTGYPVLVGLSRKSFIGRLTGAPGEPLPPEDRLEGTLALNVYAQIKGAKILRVHDVKAARRAVDAVDAALRA